MRSKTKLKLTWSTAWWLKTKQTGCQTTSETNNTCPLNTTGRLSYWTILKAAEFKTLAREPTRLVLIEEILETMCWIVTRTRVVSRWTWKLLLWTQCQARRGTSNLILTTKISRFKSRPTWRQWLTAQIITSYRLVAGILKTKPARLKLCRSLK